VKSNFFYLFLLVFCIVTFLAFFSSVQGKSGQVSEGQELFKTHCAKCHGQEGEGFLRLYPPLQNSRFLGTDVARLPCIMRNGLKGEIKVGDVTFNQIMPGNERLSAENMKQLIIFMQNAWKHPRTQLSVQDWLTNCSST